MTRTRCGYTLIEMLVVFVLISVTLTIATVTMHTLHRAESRVQKDLQGQRTLNQVATQLRWDAHEAVSAAMVGGADTSPSRSLILTLADGRSIQYSLTLNRLERIVRRAEIVEHREDYRLAYPDGYWSIDAARDHPLLALHLVSPDPRPASQPATESVPMIQAAIGIVGAQFKKEARDANQP